MTATLYTCCGKGTFSCTRFGRASECPSKPDTTEGGLSLASARKRLLKPPRVMDKSGLEVCRG